jgi:hypothetical protein
MANVHVVWYLGKGSVGGATPGLKYEKYLAPRAVKRSEGDQLPSNSGGKARAAPETPPRSIAPCSEMNKARAKAKNKECLAELEGAKGEYRTEFSNCVAVTVGTEAIVQANLRQENSKELKAAVEKLPGLYWQVGRDGYGRPVFRQELPSVNEGDEELTNTDELYLHYANASGGGGWFFTSSLVGSPTTYGYLTEVTGKVAVPYWDGKKGLPDVTSQPSHKYFAKKFGDVCEALEAKALEETERAARLEAGAAQGGGGGCWFDMLDAIIKAYEKRQWTKVEDLIVEVKNTELYKKVAHDRARLASKGRGKGGKKQHMSLKRSSGCGPY